MNLVAEKARPMSGAQNIVLFVIVILIVILGIYPEPVIHLTQSTVTDILSKAVLK
jgi:NADH:ubiquinone oxidoreductase subunit 4 (subunit M)